MKEREWCRLVVISNCCEPGPPVHRTVKVATRNPPPISVCVYFHVLHYDFPAV